MGRTGRCVGCRGIQRLKRPVNPRSDPDRQPAQIGTSAWVQNCRMSDADWVLDANGHRRIRCARGLKPTAYA